jgi:hypothetical protein
MQRSWLVIAGVAVLVAVLAGGGYWWLGHHKRAVLAAQQKHPHLIGVLGDNASELDNIAPDQDRICDASLKRAVDFGAVPPGTSLAGSEAKAEQPEGRYSCQAQGAAGKYTLGIDLSCPASEAKTCFTLDSVRREDGTIAYQIERL